MRKEEIAEVVRLTTAEVLSQRDAIMEEEFEKTPKRSIKRFLYQP